MALSSTLAAERMTLPQLGTLQMTLAMAIAGSIGVFVVESGQDPLTAAFFRCLFGAGSLALYCLAKGSFRGLRLSLRTLLLLGLAGAFLVANWVLLFESYRRSTIGLATIVYHVNPFMILLLAALFLGEPLTRRSLAWATLAFAGLVLVVAGPEELSLAGLAGALLALAAAALYSTTVVLAKRLPAVPPEVMAVCQIGIGAVLLLPLARPTAEALGGDAWLWLLGLGVLHTGVEYVLLYGAFKRLPAAPIAVLSFVYPLVAALLDALVYGHSLRWLQWLGMAVIIVATLGERLRWRAPVIEGGKS